MKNPLCRLSPTFGGHTIVPPSSRLVLEKALKDNDVKHDTVIMPNSGHSLACDLDKERELIKLIYGYCAEYFN